MNNDATVPFLIAAVVGFLTISILLYAPALSSLSINVLLFVNGVSTGGVVVAFAMVREHNEIHASATAMSFLNMGVIGAGAILQPLIGWLLDLNWEGRYEAGRRIYSAAAYDGALWVLPVSAALTILLALLVRETHGRVLGRTVDG